MNLEQHACDRHITFCPLLVVKQAYRMKQTFVTSCQLCDGNVMLLLKPEIQLFCCFPSVSRLFEIQNPPTILIDGTFRFFFFLNLKTEGNGISLFLNFCDQMHIMEAKTFWKIGTVPRQPASFCRRRLIYLQWYLYPKPRHKALRMIRAWPILHSADSLPHQ